MSGSGLKLSYWGGRGLMEVPRTTLAIAGKFPPADYEDFRAAAPPADLPAENLGRMPVVEHDGNVIGQSGAIWRYIARINNQMGTNEAEAARIDTIVCTVVELSDAWSKLMPYGNTFDAEKKAEITKNWLEAPIPAAGDRANRFLSWYLHYLEQVVGDKGFAVGAQFSLADAVIYNRFGEVAPELGAAGGPFGDAEGVAKVLDAHPKLKAIVENFRANPNIQKWLSSRPANGF